MQGMPVKNKFLDLGLRLIVGIVFLIAGIGKLPEHSEFVDVVLAYKILPFSIAVFYASVLPWLEITIGSCLILGLFTKPFSLLSIPIIVSFIFANATALSFGTGEDCGCGGVLIVMDYKVALIIDASLLIGASLIFFQRKRFMALDSQLRRLFKFYRFK